MVASLSHLVQPIMIVLLGGIVFFIILAVFMPIIQMITSLAAPVRRLDARVVDESVHRRDCICCRQSDVSLRFAQAEASWKAGTARAIITPKTPMWMSGYAARTKPSQGVVHDLWAKALAIEDPTGHRAILITLDLCGIGRDLSIRVRDTIRSRHRLERDQIVLACSHTHSGPVVGQNLHSMYNLDDGQRRTCRPVHTVLGKVARRAGYRGPRSIGRGTVELGRRPV